MLTWVEISKQALSHNIRQFRRIVGGNVLLCPCVKANAYGHGLVETAKIYLESGADWLGVNALYEAEELRKNNITQPIYILGYVELKDLEKAMELDCRLVVYNNEIIEKLAGITRKLDKKADLHIKIETGNNRQGVMPENLVEFAKKIQNTENLEVEGLTTHFANIEDTTDHTYAFRQLENFKKAAQDLENAGIKPKIKHCANSAATLLFKETHFDMVRPGIATYGLWPSNETYVSFVKEITDSNRQDLEEAQSDSTGQESVTLLPAFTWKTKIAQIKTIPAGEFIGYGCTYRTSHPTKLAILPVGYYDGYDRCTTGAHVLIHGKRAPVRGRICMNIMMVEVSDIPEAKLEDEVVLIGSGKAKSAGETGADPASPDEPCDDSADAFADEISAEQFAAWNNTINYEIPTRVNERIPRVVV